MNIPCEIIMEAAELIRDNYKDVAVLKEQKRILNQQINVLLDWYGEPKK